MTFVDDIEQFILFIIVEIEIRNFVRANAKIHEMS